MTWQQALGLALGGLPLGAMYALQAMGIVLVYKTSRVFNFAQGAIGMTAAFVASSVGVSWGLPRIVALVLALAVGVLLGVVIERFTIRPIEGALQRTVATLAWLLFLQGFAQFVWGAGNSRPFLTVFPARRAFGIDAINVNYGYDQVGVLVIATLVTVGLGLFFRRRPLGVAMRAVADAPEGANLLGIDVNTVTLVSWGLGAGMAALSGILVAPLLGTLDTVGLIIFTIQALAAALIGRLESLPLTFAGGIVLGMSQPVLKNLLSLEAGANELIAFVFVLAALLFRRQTGRKDTGGSGLPPVSLGAMPKGKFALASMAGVVIVLLAQLTIFPAGASSRSIAGTFIWSLGVLSLVLLAGVAGQVSLCQGAFMGVGGLTAAMALSAGVPFVLSILVGGLGAALAATLIGLPALRLRDLELAIVTLSLAFAADRYFFSVFKPLVGPDQRRPFPRPEWADRLIDVDGIMVTNWRPYAALTLVVFVLAAFAVASLRRGRAGGAFTALRSSEAATSAMGYSVVAVKLQGFALSGFVAGLGGALFAGLSGSASGEAFGFDRSITLLAYVVIAGIGSVPGAVLGGAIVTISASNFGGASTAVTSDVSTALTTMGTAAILMVVLIFAPRGLGGLVGSARARWAAQQERGPAAVPT